MSARLARSYDLQMRADPPTEPGQRIERTGGVVRTRGDYNTILFSELDAAHVDRAVAEQVAFFTERGEEVEWKLYSHDKPANLSSALAAAGFEPGETETLMALRLSTTAREDERPDGIEIRAVASSVDLITYLDVTTAAFGKRPQWSAEHFGRRLFDADTDTDTLAFIAYVGPEPAAAGRLELPPGRPFASIWGGGTRPHLRNRGVYRTLVRERARIAYERGYTYVTVDALETSRPILERLGFLPVATVRAWVLRPPEVVRAPSPEAEP